MSVELLDLHEVQFQVSDFTSTGDVGDFASGFPVEVVRWGIIATTTIDVGVGMVVKADKVVDGTRGDGDAGDITTSTTDITIGDGVYTEEVGSQGSGADPLVLDPGDHIVFQITDAADTAGVGVIFVHYRRKPFVADSGATGGTAANRLNNLTSND